MKVLSVLFLMITIVGGQQHKCCAQQKKEAKGIENLIIDLRYNGNVTTVLRGCLISKE